MKNILKKTPFIGFLTTLFLFSPLLQGARNELSRYIILRDREIIERNLKYKDKESFLKFFLTFSSGLKSLIGDVTDATSSEKSSVEKTVNALSLINENLNTEKYVDAHVGLGLPLPFFSVWNYDFLPSLFYSLNFSVSLSFTNNDNVTDHRAQTYLKKEVKFGASSFVKRKEKELFKLRLYRMERSDLFASLSATTLATDGELFNMDDLEKKHITYSLDFKYFRQVSKNFFVQGEIQELQILSSSSTELKSLYGTRPLINLSAGHILKGKFQLQTHFGWHFRKRYGFEEGLYISAHLKPKESWPIYIMTKIDPNFILISPQLKTKWAQVIYSIKTPFINPQNDVWVPAFHSFSLSIPFP